MASRSARIQKIPMQVILADGDTFVCPSCGRKELKATLEQPIHFFCRCGQVYLEKDFPASNETERS